MTKTSSVWNKFKKATIAAVIQLKVSYPLIVNHIGTYTSHAITDFHSKKEKEKRKQAFNTTNPGTNMAQVYMCNSGILLE